MLGIGLFLIYSLIAFSFVAYLRQPYPSPWWLKIVTELPACTYYFGPFESAVEAQCSQGDYLQDLQAEGAQGISWQVEQGQPQELTIFEES